MGLLSSLFRLLHPVSYAKRRVKRAIIPRPIRRAKWVAGGVIHPVSRVKYSTRRAVIRKVDKAITPRKRKRSPRTTVKRNKVLPLDYDDVTIAAAQGAGVPVERLRQFNALVADGKNEAAGQLFTIEEIQRIIAADRESTLLLNKITDTLNSIPRS